MADLHVRAGVVDGAVVGVVVGGLLLCANLLLRRWISNRLLLSLYHDVHRLSQTHIPLGLVDKCIGKTFTKAHRRLLICLVEHKVYR